MNHDRNTKKTITILLIFILGAGLVPLTVLGSNDGTEIDSEFSSDNYDGPIDKALVEAGYRPRFPYEGSPFIQTPEPMPEDAVVHPYGDVPMELSSGSTRASWDLYFSNEIIDVYVDTQPGELNSNEKNLLDRIIDDFVNYSFPRVKDYFDPQDRIDFVTFKIHYIDGQSGTGGYYQPGTDEFHIDRADLSWAGEIAAHEFQHYVHRQYDTYENLWVDEGCADLAAYLVYGFASAISSHVYVYLNNPFVTLPVDDYTFYQDSSTVYYGSSFMYQYYMMTHYGGKNWTRALVQRTSRGISGVNSALSSLQETDDFAETYRKFIVASRVNDDQAGDGGEFSFPQKSYPYGTLNTKLLGSYSGIPISINKEVRGWGYKSYRFSNPPDSSKTYRMKITLGDGTPTVAFYPESYGSRKVDYIEFNGNNAEYDFSGWGSDYDSFQIMVSSSSMTEFNIKLDIFDTIPPVTTLGVSPALPDGEDGWYVRNPKVTLHTEVGATTKYIIDNGNPITYDDPFYIDEGIHNLTYFSIDVRDNMENPKFMDFKVDTIEPTSTLFVQPDKEENEWYTEVPEVVLLTEDTDASLEYRFEDGVFTDYEGPIYPPEGESTLIWRAVDRAGNEEPQKTRTFRVDTIAPTLSYTIEPETPDGSNGWYTKTPVINVESENAENIYFKIDEKDYLMYDSPIEVPDGHHVVKLLPVDEAGNTGDEYRMEFKTDTSVPVITGSFDRFVYNYQNSTEWLNFNPLLTLSGSEEMFLSYSVNGGGPIEYDGPVRFHNGIHEVVVSGEDEAGNKANILEYLLKVDTRIPDLELSTSVEPSNGWYVQEDVDITINNIGEEENSSPVKIFYRWDNEEERTYKETISMLEGTHILKFRAVDEAGNEMDLQAIEFKKDSMAPILDIDIQADGESLRPGENLTIDLTGSHDENGVIYSIDYGDGDSLSWRVDDIYVHSYDEPGMYEISVSGKDRAGNVINETVSVEVLENENNEPILSDEGGSFPIWIIAVGGFVAAIIVAIIVLEIVLIIRKRSSDAENVSMHQNGNKANQIMSGQRSPPQNGYSHRTQKYPSQGNVQRR